MVKDETPSLEELSGFIYRGDKESKEKLIIRSDTDRIISILFPPIKITHFFLEFI